MTYAEITAYFERIAAAHKSIKASYVGDYEDIYKIQANPDKYQLPCLWIEGSEMTPVGSDESIRSSWSRPLVVLFKGDPQDKEFNKLQMELSYRVARAILYRIMMDTDEMRVRFSLVNKRITQIDPLASDYLIGWRIEIELESYDTDPCYDASDWNEDIEVTNALRFTLLRTETGYTAIIDEAPDSEEWTATWSYTDDADPVEVEDTELEIITEQDDIFLTLTYTHTSGLKRYASAYLSSGCDKMISVPYKISTK